ncbi:MAG: GNAT family N-acyltransferase [Chitinophagales bacterium]|nr:GNAT family N-acyltransferase [Chitinophagales bacterium]
MKSLAPSICKNLLAKDIRNFKGQDLLVSQGNFNVYLVESYQIPNVLLEIGLLREKTFREAGEGANKERDIDKYDAYYKQLIIWDKNDSSIAGGYRIGMGDTIMEAFGIDGFYLSSLFNINHPFGTILSKSLELGRSYIISEYQKQRLPLYLLWKGILAFLIKNPQYQYLIGPLSISKNYSDISKEVIRAFIEKHFYEHELAKHISPKKKFAYAGKYLDAETILQEMNGEIMQLDKFVKQMEPFNIGLPILLKKYIKLNAKIVGFNIDPNFSDVLDGFMVLDLQSVSLEIIESLNAEV